MKKLLILVLLTLTVMAVGLVATPALAKGNSQSQLAQAFGAGFCGSYDNGNCPALTDGTTCARLCVTTPNGTTCPGNAAAAPGGLNREVSGNRPSCCTAN